MRVLRIIIPAVMTVTLCAAKEPLLVVHTEPISLCNGDLSVLGRRIARFQPRGYKDPFDVKPRPSLDEYRRKIPTNIFSSQTRGRMTRGRIEVAPVKEIPDTFLVLSSERELVNYPLLRASRWIEDNYPIEKDSNFFSDPNLIQVAGHDLRSKDLQAFLDLFMRRHLQTRLPRDLKNKIRAQAEREFWSSFLVPQLEKAETSGTPFVVISAPAHPIIGRDIVGHEIFHARYFLEPPFRDACDEYWDQKVPQAQKLIFYGALLDGYSMIQIDQELAANEFQAYVLQPNALAIKASRFLEMRALWPLVLLHRKPLQNFLRSKGIANIQVRMKW